MFRTLSGLLAVKNSVPLYGEIQNLHRFSSIAWVAARNDENVILSFDHLEFFSYFPAALSLLRLEGEMWGAKTDWRHNFLSQNVPKRILPSCLSFPSKSSFVLGQIFLLPSCVSSRGRGSNDMIRVNYGYAEKGDLRRC
jgi:hypothetical protein